MSIQLAVVWAERTLRFPLAAQEAVQMFREAERDGKWATLLVSDRLTRDGKGWLVRWTGHEVVVLELSPRQQTRLGLTEGAMLRQLERPTDSSPFHSGLTLAEVSIDDAKQARADQPLAGTCRVVGDVPAFAQRDAQALRAEYFQPELNRQVTAYWHLNGPISADHRRLRFTLPPLASNKHRTAVTGAVVLFLQMIAVDDPHTMRGLRAISNTAAVLVDFCG